MVAAKTLVPSVRTRISSPPPRNSSRVRVHESTFPRWSRPSLLCAAILPSVRTRTSAVPSGRGWVSDPGRTLIARSNPPSPVRRKLHSRRRIGAPQSASTESNSTTASTCPSRRERVLITFTPDRERARRSRPEASSAWSPGTRSGATRMTDRPDPSSASRWCSSHAAGAHPRPSPRINAAPADP